MHFNHQQLPKLRKKRAARRAKGSGCRVRGSVEFRLPPSAFRLRPAFTLVELLVVISIIVTVSAIVVPLLTPVIDSRRIRETARIVSTQFASAQSEAMAKGRPVGVWIERLSSEPSAAMDLYLCEVPQPYSGDSIDSRIIVNVDSSGTPTKCSVQFSGDTSWYGLLRPGDLIRFNYRGPWYTFTSDTPEYQGQPTNTLTAPDANGIKFLDNSAIKAIDRIRTSPIAPVSSQSWALAQANYQDCQLPIPSPTNTPDRPYQILRQPVKSASQPVQLPAGSVIDLFASGTASAYPYFGGVSGFSTNKSPVIVTFSKSGALDSFYAMGQKFPLVEPIHFLLGQREKLPHAPNSYNKADPPETQAEKHNFRDLENLWISINPQTGLITSAEVAQVQDSSLNGANEDALLRAAIPQSRQFATSAQTMGGK